jgi:hypothetical protein
LIQWIMGYSAEVKVKSPQSLKEILTHRLNKALKMSTT